MRSQQERKARLLNTQVEGKYSKKMAIPRKDLFHDAQAVRANRKDLLEQAFEKQQTVLSDKLQQKETEIDLISQIKATLREAQTQK